jgi:DNA-binding NarL/FixJ family response regulator
MAKDIRVLLIEDDPYARDLMALLLTRDWRTQVIGEFGTKDDVSHFLSDDDHRVDLIILDTEHPERPDWPLSISEMIRSFPKPPIILYTGTMPKLSILQSVVKIGGGGYIMKGEVLYALATAVALAYSNNFVVTPGVVQISPRRVLPLGTKVINGKKRITTFTRRENDLVRLGIIFNLALRDIADELVLSPGWVSEIVSTVYKKLGMREILTGESPLEAYFEDDAVLERFRKITGPTQEKKPDQGFRKSPWMATLAFHLLTLPEIKEI